MIVETGLIRKNSVCRRTARKVWLEKGYDDFADGTFGNGGQNIYVSRAGVLQRIFHFDLNRNGYMDLLFVNSQDMDERLPAYIYTNPLETSERVELPSQGAYYAAVGDLTGNGCADIVIANQNNGTHTDLTADIYFWSPEGFSERYKLELPAPNCRAVAIGDFNGNGRSDIAFGSEGKLRIFYQTECGFLASKYEDIDIEVTHLFSTDLDGDGCDELYVRIRGQEPRILWGGKDGINPERATIVGGKDIAAENMPSTTPGWIMFVEGWRPKAVTLKNKPYVFRQENGKVCLYPLGQNRQLEMPLILDCDNAMSVAVGDIKGKGGEDIVVAVCKDRNQVESSWVYWANENGYDNQNRSAIPTQNARDIVVADLNRNGNADVVVCQGGTDILFSTESLIFAGSIEGLAKEPIRLETHDATAVFVVDNGQERPSLIFANHVGGRVRGDVLAYLYHGGPDGYSPDRKQELPSWSAPDALCCDFNDDGWADVLMLNCAENAVPLDPGSFVYWNSPEGFDANRKQVVPTLRAHGGAVGDFRHSGYLDLAVAGFVNPELMIFRGMGNGFDVDNPQRIMLDPDAIDYRPVRGHGFTKGLNQELWQPRFLFTADFNNDGWLDLFVSQCMGQRSLILWGGPEGFSLERSQWLNAEGGICAQAADLTGNGWLDLVVGGHQCSSKRWKYDSYIYIYWGGPDGFREDRRTQLPAHACNSLTIADFNNDGILDIFATSYNSGRDRDTDSFIYWGGPKGVYSHNNRTRLFTHSASGCISGDFNEDGWIDIAVANHKTYGNHVGKSQVWWNGPDGLSEKNITELPTTGPHGMLTIDPGNIMDRGNEEYYESSPCQLEGAVAITCIKWQAELPLKTWVKAQIRTAATLDQLKKGNWQGPKETGDWFENNEKFEPVAVNGQWIQYRLALGAINGGSTPRITSVEIEYK